MKNIMKHWSKFGVCVAGIIAISTFLKLYRLNYLPVFGDEAIYIRWAQVMRAEPTLRFIPLSDGKQPLFMWVIMPFLKVFNDPLIAGRIVSVFTGIGSSIGVLVLSYLFFKSKTISFLALVIYSFAPFSFFFDRLALVDATLSFFGIWSVVFTYLSVRHQRFDFAMIAGFFLGAALLTKSPALFFALIIPMLVLKVEFGKNRKKWLRQALKLTGYFIVIYIISYGMYNFILRLGPNFHMISLRNGDYVFPISHFFSNPKDPFIHHLNRAKEWFIIYSTPSVVFLFVLGFFAMAQKWKDLLILSILLFFPIFVQSEFAKVFTTRYIYFTFPYFSIISAYSVSILSSKRKIVSWVFYFLCGTFLFVSINFYKLMITNLDALPLARTDRSGFLEEWTSGTGIYEVSSLIRTEYYKDSSKKIVVGTEGYFGTLPDGLQMYLNDLKDITVIGTGIDLKSIPNSLIEAADSGASTYFVINDSRLKFDYSETDKLKLIAVYPKAFRPENIVEYNIKGPREILYLFKVVSNNTILNKY